MFDVLVIGAGPAGCAAARTLAADGYRVLLVEKHRMPRYKSCSGQLIRKSLAWIETVFGRSVPPHVMCTPEENRGMILTDAWGKAHCFAQSGCNVWRAPFDHWLACMAAEQGAEVRDGTVACGISCGADTSDSVTVTLQRQAGSDGRGRGIYTECARYVIDCEGVPGTLKKQLLATPLSYITTYQTYNRGQIDLDPHYFYAYLQPELSEYDAWFNVKDDRLVLGVSVKHPTHALSCYGAFLAYMERENGLRIDEQIAMDRWLMPHIQPGCDLSLCCSSEGGGSRMLFAGEIAGFLNPMGEGISAALESGYLCARAIMQHVGSPEHVGRAYRESISSLHAYMRRQWRFVSDMADSFAGMRM